MPKSETEMATILTPGIVALFDIDGHLSGSKPYGNGHINDTILVTMTSEDGGRYIFQRINAHVFLKPEVVMSNFCAITDHLRTYHVGAPESEMKRLVLRHVPAKDGRSYVLSEDGDYWRATHYIEDSIVFDALSGSLTELQEAARAFGQFIRQMTDFKGAPLPDTITDFHNTGKRYVALHKAVSDDTEGRVCTAREEIDMACKWEHLADKLQQVELPERLVHCDTKVNNVLFSRNGKALAVTDLDTVMMGLTCYDFGELVRTSTSNTTEDEKDVTKVQVNVERFEQLALGFLSELRLLLTEREVDSLVTGAMVMALENGVRFLTDFLEGDKYFKTTCAMQNLQRSRVQFAIVKEIIDKEATLVGVVNDVWKKLPIA